MSVKSQQVTKDTTAKRAQAAPAVTNRARGFAGNHTLQRKQSSRETIEQHANEATQRLRANDEKELPLQREASNGQAEPSTVAPIVQEVLRSPGQPLDPATRAFMEPRFGHDLSHVRVHNGGRASESARAVNAMAYTVGRDVVFGAGQYGPSTSASRQLLAHELTHVLQQQAGVDLRAGVGHAGDFYERHADAVAERVTQGASVAPMLGKFSSGQTPGGMSFPPAAIQFQKGSNDKPDRGASTVQDPTSNPATGAIERAKVRAGSKPPRVVAKLDLNADVESANRTEITISELLDAKVGHAWVTLRHVKYPYEDAVTVPENLDSLTKSLVQTDEGAPMGFWPLIHRVNEWLTGSEDAKEIQERQKAGYTPGAGASSDTSHTGFSFDPRVWVPGRVEEPDTAHSAKGTKTYWLTQPMVDSLMTWVAGKRNSKYNLYQFNCTTFAIGAVQAAGYAPPDATPDGYSTYGITLPTGLYEEILKMKMSGDASATTTPLEPGTTETKPKTK